MGEKEGTAPGAEARQKAAAAAAKIAKEAKADKSSSWAKAGQYMAGTIVVLSAAAGGLQLYDAIFPAWPKALPLDTAGLSAVLTYGEPSIILCKNITTVDTAGQTAAKAAYELGINSYIADCDTVLGSSGASLYERLGLQRWNPAWGVVANGKRAVQLSPSLLYKHTELAEKAKPMLKEPRHTRLDGERDLDLCLRERAGGCLVVYSSRDKEKLAEEAGPIAQAYRNTTVAGLNSGKLVLRAAHSGLSEAIKAAVSAAVAVSSGAHKGAVLLHFKRVAPSLMAGDSSRVLVTVSSTAGPSLTLPDAASLMRTASAAYALLKGEGGAAAGRAGGPVSGGDEVDASSPSKPLSEDALDALLARDDSLAALGALLVSRSELSIGRAPVKARPTPPGAPKTGQQGGSEEAGEGEGEEGVPLSSDARRSRRTSARVAREEEKAQAAGLTPEQAAEARRRREKEIRETMAREEAESAHFAADAEGAEAWSRGGGGEEEEQHAEGEGVDLDEVQEQEEEL